MHFQMACAKKGVQNKYDLSHFKHAPLSPWSEVGTSSIPQQCTIKWSERTTPGHKCDSGAEEKYPLILAAMGGNVKILKPSSLPSSCLLTDRWRTRSLKGGQDNRGKQSKRTRSYQL